MISLALAIAIAPPDAAVERYNPPPSATDGMCVPRYPPNLTAWRAGRPFVRDVAVGRTAQLSANPIANVRLAIQPSKPLTGTHYASASFTIAKSGTYQVAVGGIGAAIRPLWLDVAGVDRKPLTSVAHAHGPDCTSVTKVVDYTLQPGSYTFLVTGLTSAAPVRVLVVRK